MSAVFPPVKENIYILSWPYVPRLPESLPGGGRRGRSRVSGFPRETPPRAPGRAAGRAVGGRAALSPSAPPPHPPAVARGAGTHLASSRPGSPPPPPPPPPSTSHSSKGASLTAPHEIIIHYVTRREVRECKCLDGIRGNPRRDDLGAVIIHLIGAWGKLLDRELELNQPRKGVRQGCVGELASLAIFKRFHLRMRHKTRYYFIHLVWWPLAFLCMNIKFEMAAQQHILESVLWAVICMVGLVSRLLTF